MFLPVAGYAKPSELDSSEYASDNYQNDEDDSNDEVQTKPGSIVSSPMTLTVKEGDNVLLPCNTINGGNCARQTDHGSRLPAVTLHLLQIYTETSG